MAQVLEPEPPPKMAVSEAEPERGGALFNRFCGRRHGANAVGDGSVPDLRRERRASHPGLYHRAHPRDKRLREAEGRWAHLKHLAADLSARLMTWFVELTR